MTYKPDLSPENIEASRTEFSSMVTATAQYLHSDRNITYILMDSTQQVRKKVLLRASQCGRKNVAVAPRQQIPPNAGVEKYPNRLLRVFRVQSPLVLQS